MNRGMRVLKEMREGRGKVETYGFDILVLIYELLSGCCSLRRSLDWRICGLGLGRHLALMVVDVVVKSLSSGQRYRRRLGRRYLSTTISAEYQLSMRLRVYKGHSGLNR